MKRFLFLCVLITACGVNYAQQLPRADDEVIQSLESRLITNYKTSNLGDLLSGNREALAVYEKAKRTETTATVFGCIGGFGIGWCLGGMLFGPSAGQRTEQQQQSLNTGYVLGGIGVVCLGVGIGINSKAVKLKKKAAGIYNEPIHEELNRLRGKTEYTLGMTDSGGFGLQIIF